MIIQNWIDYLRVVLSQALTELGGVLPQLLAGLIIFLVGMALARLARRITHKSLQALKLSQMFKNTPVEYFLENTGTSLKIEGVVAGSVYWLIMLVVLQTTVSVLGLAPLTLILDRLISYIPKIVAAILIIFFGLLLAGVIEATVKGAVKTISGQQAHMLGKFSSYLVMVIAVMAGISELGIASDFIRILFVGMVGAVSLAGGLAFGLGGKDVVKKLLDSWAKENLKK